MTPGKSKRIFVALIPKKDTIEKISIIQSQFQFVDGLKLVSKNNLHLTLIPPMNTSDVDKLVSEIQPIINVSGKPKLFFNKVAYGVNPSDPKLVWLLGRPLRSNLRRLYRGLSTKLSYKSDKKFKPHITLAKISDGVGELPKIKQTQLVTEFDKLAILESIRTESGQIYKPIYTYNI